jgi:outer membrane protein assembly factor BamD (BamD/ComL family)
VKRDIIRSSLKFADTFPMHEKAAVVLGAAADDLYEMKDYERTIATAHKLIDQFPKAEQDVRRAAWLVEAHSSFALEKFEDAEKGYVTVVQLTAETDKTREAVIDNLAASIYKQGEQARKRGDHKVAADHFLRIATVAPTSKIRPTAEYDAATALLQLKEWGRAVEILEAFRKNYPANELLPSHQENRIGLQGSREPGARRR